MLLKALDLAALILFFLPIPYVIFFQSRFNYYWDYVTSIAEESGEVYDFIVVGSGSAGAVIINRLSKNNKVLVLEAGGDPFWYNSVPAAAMHLLHRPETDWLHKTVPQKHAAFGSEGNVSLWPRGKLLGGSSNLNYMVYNRGNPHDYDNWANLTGDASWNYESILKYFKKSLDYDGKYIDDDVHYGSSAYGKLHVENPTWTVLQDEFFSAAREVGFKEYDLNAPQREGYGALEFSQRKGKRSGTYQAFLKDILSRPTLKISRFSQAIKIELDKNNRAIGVWYVRHGKKIFARASKEVIISAGAVDSPKLLMLSGIGPKNHLKSIKIKSKIDLPVGKNLKDHVAILFGPFVVDKPVIFIPDEEMGIKSFVDYFYEGSGPLVSSVMSTSQLQFCSNVSICKKTKLNRPDIQIYFVPVNVHANYEADFSQGYGFRADLVTKYFSSVQGKNSFMFVIALNLPRSTGEIELKDKDPLSPPLIDPKYLKNYEDVQALVDGAKMVVKLAEETKAFQEFKSKLHGLSLPGCEQHKFRSDAYWECYIRHMAMTLYHPVRTCKMGSGQGDPNSVVDSKLRVIGTIGLRVADASIMPDITAGNTNAPSIMIGEKASDMIREHWSQQFLVSYKSDRLMGKNVHERCFYSRLV